MQGAAKGARRYRYFVSRALVSGAGDTPEQGWRVPAPELERAVRAVAQQMLTDRAALAEAVEQSGIDATNLPSVLKAAQVWSDRLRSGAEAAPALAQVSERVELMRDGIQVALTLPLPTGPERDAATSNGLVLTRFVPMRIRRRGVEMRMVVEGTPPPSRVDLPLLKAVARAYRWADDLLSGRAQSVGEIARRERVSGRYVWRLIRLGFLAPKIVEAIIEGRHPEALTASALTQRIDLPALWSAQERALAVG